MVVGAGVHVADQHGRAVDRQQHEGVRARRPVGLAVGDEREGGVEVAQVHDIAVAVDRAAAARTHHQSPEATLARGVGRPGAALGELGGADRRSHIASPPDLILQALWCRAAFDKHPKGRLYGHLHFVKLTCAQSPRMPVLWNQSWPNGRRPAVAGCHNSTNSNRSNYAVERRDTVTNGE